MAHPHLQNITAMHVHAPSERVLGRLYASAPISVLSKAFGRLGNLFDHRVSRVLGGGACGQEPRSLRMRLRPATGLRLRPRIPTARILYFQCIHHV